MKCTNEEPCRNCDICDREDDRHQKALESELDTYCKHDMLEDECLHCQGELEQMADGNREASEWVFYHPQD